MMIPYYSSLGKNGQLTTKSIITFECDACHETGSRLCKRHNNIIKNHLSNGLNLCSKCWRDVVITSEEYRSKLSAALKKVAADPTWRERNSQSKRGKINKGDKNGMKNPDARQRASQSRKKLLSDPEQRRKISEYTKKAWADGKFDNVNVGRCTWYSYTKCDGSVCKLQGTWELAYAHWLDEHNIQFESHRDQLEYIDDENCRHHYMPDFKLSSDHYVEIKNDYHLSLQPKKLDFVRHSNPNIKIDLLMKEDLLALGIVL